MKISKRTLIMALSVVLALSVTAFGTVAYMTDRASATNTFTVGNVDITVDEENVDNTPAQPGDDDYDPQYPEVDLDGDGKPDEVDKDDDGTITITPGDPAKPPIVIEPDEDGGYPDADVDGDDTPDDIEVNGDEIIITPGVPEGEPEKDPIVLDPIPNVPDRDTENEYKLIPGKEYVKDPTMTVKAGSEECYVRMRVELNCINELKAILDKHEISYAYEKDILDKFVTIDNTVWEYTSSRWGDTSNICVFEFRYKEAVSAATADKVLPALFETFTVPSYFDGADLKTISGMTLEVEGHAIQTATFESAADAWAAFANQVGE